MELCSRQIAAKIGRSKFAVQRYLRKNSITPPKEVIEKFRVAAMTGRTSFTKAEDDFITANYLLLCEKQLASTMHRSHTGVKGRMKHLGLIVPKELIEQRKKDSQIKPGNISFNKGKKQIEYMSADAIERSKATRFKKGHHIHNKKPLGSQRITKDGYLEIKTQEPNKWEQYHRLIWEETFGPIPKDKIVRFITKDKMNVHPFNLELIDRKINMKNNTIHRYPMEVKQSIRILSKLKKRINEKQVI
jgi:hypothetical protein